MSLRRLSSPSEFLCMTRTLLQGDGRRVVTLPPLLTASRVKLLPSGGHFSLHLASVETEAGANVTYDLELTVTGPVHGKPGMCSTVVTTSPLYTLHELPVGSSLSPTVAVHLIPSRHLRPVPFYIQKRWSLLSFRGP